MARNQQQAQADPWMVDIGGGDGASGGGRGNGDDGGGAAAGAFSPSPTGGGSYTRASNRNGLGTAFGNSAIEDNPQLKSDGQPYRFATGDTDDPFTAWEDSLPRGGNTGSLVNTQQAQTKFLRGNPKQPQSLNFGTIGDPTQVSDPHHRGYGMAVPLKSIASEQPWGFQGAPVAGGSQQPDATDYPEWGAPYALSGAPPAPGGAFGSGQQATRRAARGQDPGGGGPVAGSPVARALGGQVTAMGDPAGFQPTSPPPPAGGVYNPSGYSAGGVGFNGYTSALNPGAPSPGEFPGSEGTFGGMPVQGGAPGGPTRVEITSGNQGTRGNPLNLLAEHVRNYTDNYHDSWNNTAAAGGLFGSINVPRPSDFIKVGGDLKNPHAYLDTRFLSGGNKPWIDLSKQDWLPSDLHKSI